MKYFVIFFETLNPDAIREALEFKKKINNDPITKMTVIQTVEINYDFLYNSLIEKANKEIKHDRHPTP